MNALAVALEIPKNIELVRSFREVIHPPFEVVMASQSARDGSLSGHRLSAVPTLWVLNREGEKKYEFSGPANVDQLTKVVTSLQ